MTINFREEAEKQIELYRNAMREAGCSVAHINEDLTFRFEEMLHRGAQLERDRIMAGAVRGAEELEKWHRRYMNMLKEMFPAVESMEKENETNR